VLSIYQLKHAERNLVDWNAVQSVIAVQSKGQYKNEQKKKNKKKKNSDQGSASKSDSRNKQEP